MAAGGAAAPRVVVLGDSLVAGYGLPEAEGFVPALAAWLDAHDAAAEVINAGVSGDTSAGGLARAAWALGGGADALVVILGGNDMLRGIPPAETRRNLGAILKIAHEAGVPALVVGMKAPANLGPDYRRAFDALYPEVAREAGALFFPDFFAGLRDAGATTEDAAALATWMQPDGLHPNADGVQVIVDAIGPAVHDLLGRTGPDRPAE